MKTTDVMSFSVQELVAMGKAKNIEKDEWLRVVVMVYGELQTIKSSTESEPTRSWREEDGIIYFNVTSNGTTGENWIKRLEDNGICVGNDAKQILCSPSFKPTSGITTEVAVLKSMLFADDDRTTEKIHAKAKKLKLKTPNAELACLIREKFTDKDIKDMGLWWIVTMHEPIKGSDGDPSLLSVSRHDDGRWLCACSGRFDGRWSRESGFAFVVSQV
jgi:hypothetical protein